VDFRIQRFDPHRANQSEFAALTTLENHIRAEQWPEDSPFALEEVIGNLRFAPPLADTSFWVAWQKESIMGRARLSMYRTEQNRHLADFDIAVLPSMRRRGVAKQLLQLCAEQAHRQNRRLLQTHTDAAVPSGGAFLKRLGARMGMASHTNQLNLAQLDRGLIRRWQERAPTGEFELGMWKGSYPEVEIEAVVELVKVMNTEPRDDLELEDWHWTAEHLRQWQTSLRQRKVEQWTMYARESATGRFAGYTEVFWNPYHPENLQQGDTGVFPQYRNRGLGRWLKAAMLEKVLRERPQVKRMRTGNADSNAPMLKINRELGFTPYKSWNTWQVELSQVLEYCSRQKAYT
jgi:mycothiol synthase